MIKEYCPVCERETTHRLVDDDTTLFECAIECLNCHTIWEAESDLINVIDDRSAEGDDNT